MNTMFALRAAAAIAALSSAGCGLFYRNSFPGPAFTIYSDRDPAFLAEIGEKVTRIYAGYQRLFEPAPGSLGTTTIVLEGTESGIVDHGYSPSLLGYYVPLFNYIHIDTVPVWTRNEEFLEQVILHEVAHHFIVSEWPAASGECWLNEGLAGALEVSVFRGQRFESPLINPVLYQIAHRAAYDQERKLDLKRFLAMNWDEFHDREAKERHYALAWSIVYFALERVLPREATIGERIEMLYRMDRSALARLEPEWIAFLKGFDVAGSLLALARDEGGGAPLTASWAIRQLGSLRALDDLRVLEGLVSFFADSDVEKRGLAYISFLQRLEKSSNSQFLSASRVEEGLARLDGILEDPDEPAPLREALAMALGASFKTRGLWLPRLVSLLDQNDAEIRAAAARTLSLIGQKPTVVNPAFWKAAPREIREREVAEWREWLASQPREALGLP